jgi:RHS repeat-associated protein
MFRAGRGAFRARPRVLTSAQLAAAFLLTTLFTFPFALEKAGPDRASAGSRQRVELVKLRTRTSKTYRNGNGSLTTTLFSGSVNYRQPRGGWRSISSRLVPAQQAGYAWRNEANSFKTFFRKQITDDDYLRFGAAGLNFGFELEDAEAESSATANGGRVSYRDAVEGVDLRYALFADGLKETLVLPDAGAPTSYRFVMTPPAGVRTRAERQEDGSWAILLGSRARPLFVFEAPTAEDADGVRGGSPKLDIVREGRRFVLELTIGERWLKAPGRSFPVLLDPTITIQPASQDASFNDACPTCTPLLDTKLYIGTTATERWRTAVKFNLGDVPPGANVTDARLKLYYGGSCVPPADGICKPLSAKLDAHRITDPWSEASTSAAIVFDATPVASLDFTTIADADVQWLSWDVTATTRDWLSLEQSNNGLLLKRETEPPSSSGPAVFSRRYTTEPSLQPKLEVTYSGDGVDLLPLDTLHANGAELRWTRYTGPSGAPFVKYEVHRSAAAKFVPTSSTLLATLGDQNVTSFRDTTAAPSKWFSYRVVANSSVSNERRVLLPGPGNSNKTLQPLPLEGKATYVDNAGAGCTNHGAESDVWLSADLAAVRRGLLHFDLRDIPTTATINGARLSVWRPFHAGVNAWVDLHRVTSAWEEGTGADACTGDGASWNETEGGVGWSSPGVDYDPTPAKSINSNNGAVWNLFYIEPLVQQWVSGQAPNLGVLLKLQNETPVDKRKFRYYGDDFSVAPTLRPKLYVAYTDGSQAQGPTVSIAAPAGADQVGGTGVQVKAAASDDRRVDKVQFFVDGGATPFATDTAPPFEATWNSTGVANGGHTLSAKATDDAGNATTSSPVDVTVHNSALPTTSVSSPAPGAAVTGTTTVSASAGDDLGVTKVEFYADDLLVAEDTTAPYSVSWNTLNQAQPSYDGSHALTTKVYDTGGQATTSAPTNVTTVNTSGTKYKATFASTEFPQSVIYDPAAGTQDKYGLDVTVTNNSATTWTASDVVLKYRWYSPDATPVITDGPEVSLGSDLLPGEPPRTLRVMAEPPALPEGVNKAEYLLRVDLYSKANAAWFADKGNKPLENPVIVNKALLRNALGLERYYHYTGEELGAGMQHLVNVANGNSIVRWTPFMAPGRGLSTVVDLTYNSLEKKCECPAGNNWSLSISGLTRFGNPFDIHPNKADEIAGRSNKYIELTDGDGTTHRFSSADGITYQEPAGVHLFLRRYSTTDLQRKWALTRPDRVTFFYNDEGYPTFVRDKNGNELAFTLEATPPGDDPGGPKKRITGIRDAGGRDFAIAYYSKAEAKKAHVRGKIKSITDHSGSALTFDYYEDGNLLRLTQVGSTTADGVTAPSRGFVFTYTTSSGNDPAIPDPAARENPQPKTANQSTRLYSVRDPRGKETLFTYLASGAGENRWRLSSRTDRALAPTLFAYDIDNRMTTITAPLSRVSKYAYDSDGKVTTITNPTNQVTTVTWTPERHVDTVTEPGGGFADYDYNANGYLTVEKVLRDKNDPSTPGDDVFARTELEYQNLVATNGDGGTTDTATAWAPGRGIPHISQPIKKTEPNGFAPNTSRGNFEWTFSYDAKGNLDKVIEPGSELIAQRPTTLHAYAADGTGDLVSTTDPNGHVTKFQQYDANGFPTRIEDAEANVTRFGYDSDGQLLWLQDARHTNGSGRESKTDKTHFYYDEFHRLARQSAPKSTSLEPGRLIWTGAEYDPNDNLTVEYSPGFGALMWVPGVKTTMEYDAMDRQTAVNVPHDPANPDPAEAAARRTESGYDLAGRVTRITLPLGVRTPSIGNDYVTEYNYDQLDRPLTETRYPKDGTLGGARTTNYCYDLVGDLRSVTAPKNAIATGVERFSACPAETAPHVYTYTPARFTTKLAYFADHELRSETDALGNTESIEYDLNGNVTRATDAEQNVTTRTYNERDLLTRTEETLFDGRAKGTLKTILDYDKAGNLIREASPRAADTVGANGPFAGAPYVTEYSYDKLGRPTLVKLPADAATRQAWVHNFYDSVGNLTSTSLPVETADRAFVAEELNKDRRTNVTYFDTGWIRTTDDPGKLVVSFDYTAEGWQSFRQGTTRDQHGDLAKAGEEIWTYFADGLVASEKDPNGDPQNFGYDANGNPVRSDDANGVAHDSEAPISVELDYNGFDEIVEVRQRKRVSEPWRLTTYAYDLDGNVDQRVDPKLRADGSDERRTNNFAYDDADRVTKHTDLGGPSCGDEQRVETNYLRNDWISLERVLKSSAACEAEASWPLRQQTAYEYFGTGLLKKQTTWQGAQLDGNVVESHTLEYENSGVYLNGHATVDSFSLKGPAATADGPAECRDYSSSPVQLCKYRYRYDARERLVNWSLSRKDVESGEPGVVLSAINYTLDEDNPNTDPSGGRTLADALVGDVVREETSGLWTDPEQTPRTFSYYPSGRLKTVTTGSVAPTTDYHSHWQTLGSAITCVTSTVQPASNTPTPACKDGSTQPGLLDWSKFDPLDRLSEFRSHRSGATLDSSYTYDAFDRLSSQTDNPNGTGNSTTSFGYLGLTGAAVTESQSGVRSATKSYTYDAFGRRVGMAVSEGGTTRDFSYARNAHGDVSLLLNDAGTATAAYGYKPYGALDNDSGGTAAGLSRGDTSATHPLNAYRFNDRRFDPGSGSIDMGARRFSPDTGRFLQPDFYRDALDDVELSQDPLTQNRHSFAGGNPVSFVETDGHDFSLRRLPGLLCGYERGGNQQANWFKRKMCGEVSEAVGKTINRRNLARCGFIPFVGVGCATLDAALLFSEGHFVQGVLAAPGLKYVKIGRRGVEGIMLLGAGKYHRKGRRVVIGKMDDLTKPGAIRRNERTLLLPNLGNPRANWKQNASRLREAMRSGKAIRDASVDKYGRLINNTGFLRAERELLRNKGWTYSPFTRRWYPPSRKRT